MENPSHCGEPARNIGPSRDGFRRYQCRICRKTWTSEELAEPKVVQSGPVHPGCTQPSCKRGRSRSGKQQWLCPDCKKTWLESPNPVGRPPLEDGGTTNAERCRRWRRKKQKEQPDSY